MPLSYGPVLIELSKELAQDRVALSQVKMHRTACSYLMTEGISHVLHQRLTKRMQKHPFSVTLDEAPSANHKKILGILVSYVNVTERRIETHHYRSLEVIFFSILSLVFLLVFD